MHRTRRDVLSLLAGSAAAGLAGPALAQAQRTMVTVVKLAGVPWFGALERGLRRGGEAFGIAASMVGPADIEAAQQAALLEQLIARKVDAIGLVPLDEALLAPVLRRAQAAGIAVITHEGPDQDGRSWNVELIESVAFGEAQMKALAEEMKGEGQYAVLVGTLATPLHNDWADAAIAYQRRQFPGMTLVAERLPGADELDTAAEAVRTVLAAHPQVKGFLIFGANGPIAAGETLRAQGLGDRIAIVGTVLPSQAKPLIQAGIIRAGFLWNPGEAGYAMVAVARRVLDGQPVTNGMEIAGLGAARVDAARRQVMFDRTLRVDRQTIDAVIAQGL